jgi:hypothetical protein
MQVVQEPKSNKKIKLLNSRVTHGKRAWRADCNITNRLYENQMYFLTAVTEVILPEGP